MQEIKLIFEDRDEKMYNNIPIWVQEIIIMSIQLFVVFSYLIYVVVIMYSIELIKTKDLNAIRKPVTVVIILAFVAAISQYAFFRTDYISLDEYTVNKIRMDYYDGSNEPNDIEIDEPEKIDKLLGIFEGAQIKRMLLPTRGDRADLGTVYIDFWGINEKSARPFHFIIHKELIKVYESGNTAFMYKVKYGVNDLYNEVHKFIDEYEKVH